jgi:hypothetical protein
MLLPTILPVSVDLDVILLSMISITTPDGSPSLKRTFPPLIEDTNRYLPWNKSLGGSGSSESGPAWSANGSMSQMIMLAYLRNGVLHVIVCARK